MSEEEYQIMMKSATLCTLGLALAMALNPGASMAQSHCRGLAQDKCSTSVACQWREAAEAGTLSKKGTPRKTAQRAHCRLDVRAASKLAKEITDQRQAKN
jgi:hypothetical protein